MGFAFYLIHRFAVPLSQRGRSPSKLGIATLGASKLGIATLGVSKLSIASLEDETPCET